MIEVFINGERFEFDEKDFKNFNELYEHVRPPGKVLVSLKVNDIDIPISKLSEIMNSYFEGGEKVEFEFKSMRAASKDLVNSGKEYILRIKAILGNLSDQFLQDSKKGYEMMAKIAEGLTMMEEIRESLGKVTGTTIEEMGMTEDFKKSVEILNRLTRALKDRDVVEIMDIVDTDLTTVYDTYLRYLNKMEELLGETS